MQHMGKGGPIVDDKISYEWHDRSSLEEDAPTNSVSAGGVDMTRYKMVILML